jgi:hypothetical protein
VGGVRLRLVLARLRDGRPVIDILLVVPVAVVAAALGAMALRAAVASPRDAADELLAATIVGLGLLGIAGLAFAAVGMLRPWPLVVSGLVAIAAGGRHVAGAVRAVRRPTRWSSRVAIGLCALVLLAELPAAIAPPVGGDQTWYGLVYPKLYGAAGALVATPWTYWGQQQFTEGFVYAVAFALRGDVLARLLNLLTGAVAAAAIASLARRHLGRDTGAAGGALFFTLPMTCALMLRMGPGLALVAYVALGTSALLDWMQTERAGDLRRAALLAGLAAGTSVVGLLAAAVLATLVFVVTVDRAWPIGRAIAGGLGAIAIVAVVASPWYVRNALQTGDPVYPFGERVFHGRDWSPAAAQYLADQGEQFRSAAIGERERPRALDVAWTPWDLTMHPGAPRATYDVGPFALAFLPAVVLLGRRRERALVTVAVAMTFVAAAAWTEPRAALPGIALAVAVAVPAVAALCGGRLAAVIVAAALIANVATAANVDRQMWLDQVRTSVGLTSPDAFLRAWSPRYRFWARANAAIPVDGTVGVLEKSPRPYYIERPFVLLSYLEQGLVDYRSVDTVEALARQLSELHVRWVAVDTAGLEAAGDPFEASVTRLWRALLATQGELVLRSDGFALYALRPVTEFAAADPSLRAAEGLLWFAT